MEIQRVFEDVIRDGALGVRAAGELCDTLVKYLLLRIASSGECGGKELSPAFSTYLRCREHINKNFVHLHTLNQIAQAMHLDHAYLCRLFKRYDRETPHQLLTRLKMRHAAELLEDPDVLVKQAASQLGYEDTFHFSRIFKKVFGVSPK